MRRRSTSPRRPAGPRTDSPPFPTVRVLGVDVAAVQIEDVIARMEEWIAAPGRSRYVAVANAHMMVEASDDESFRAVLAEADLVVPDGTPLVWLARRHGHALRRRVYGPDLMLEFLRRTQSRGYRHFFYGAEPGIAEAMVAKLRESMDVESVGCHAPPFRAVTAQEERDEVALINRARPDVLWVALGCPKQERWMREHRDRLEVPVMVGVGQAFPIIAGTLPQAPSLLREHGLEWLFRLALEPRRLWKRYLVGNSKFVFRVLLESLGRGR